METILIRCVQKKKTFKVSQLKLKMCPMSNKHPATNPIRLLLKQKQSTLHSFQKAPTPFKIFVNTELDELKCSPFVLLTNSFHSASSASNVHSVTSAGLLSQLHLAFIWGIPPVLIRAPHTNTHKQSQRRQRKASQQVFSGTGQDRLGSAPPTKAGGPGGSVCASKAHTWEMTRTAQRWFRGSSSQGHWSAWTHQTVDCMTLHRAGITSN